MIDGISVLDMSRISEDLLDSLSEEMDIAKIKSSRSVNDLDFRQMFNKELEDLDFNFKLFRQQIEHGNSWSNDIAVGFSGKSSNIKTTTPTIAIDSPQPIMLNNDQQYLSSLRKNLEETESRLAKFKEKISSLKKDCHEDSAADTLKQISQEFSQESILSKSGEELKSILQDKNTINEDMIRNLVKSILEETLTNTEETRQTKREFVCNLTPKPSLNFQSVYRSIDYDSTIPDYRKRHLERQYSNAIYTESEFDPTEVVNDMLSKIIPQDKSHFSCVGRVQAKNKFFYEEQPHHFDAGDSLVFKTVDNQDNHSEKSSRRVMFNDEESPHFNYYNPNIRNPNYIENLAECIEDKEIIKSILAEMIHVTEKELSKVEERRTKLKQIIEFNTK